MFKKLIATTDDAAPLIARLVLGLVIFPHGAQKALGLFGGPGISGTIGFMHGMMHIPVVLVYLAIAAEFLGSLGLIAGFLGRLAMLSPSPRGCGTSETPRVAAFGIACNMLVAIFTAHMGNGFFMNWGGTQKGEGFEYHLLAIGLALIVMVYGSGRASVDRALFAGARTRGV